MFEKVQAIIAEELGIDKEKITKHGKILCQTYINEGICPCMKHFPGHGKALNDPHAMTPVINCSLQELENDFYPFKNLNNMPAGMTAHIVLPQIDDKNPITISKKGIDYVIRGIIGFNGFLISDALEMHALKGNITDNAIAAWDAGCDAVCYCMGDAAIIESICVNGRYLNDTSLERFKTIKQIISNKKETIVLDKEIKAYYSETSNLDYKVYLKKNNFYSENYLGKDQMYIASLIDYINTDFDYTFRSDENIGLEYSYFVEAIIQVTD
mgnify:CR=1 FL=1